MALRPTRERRTPPPDPAAVPSSARLDCGTQVWWRRKAPISLEDRAATRSFSCSGAVLYSDPGLRASRRDPLERVTTRMAGVDDRAFSRYPRRHRSLAAERGGPLLDQVREFADRRVDTDDFGNVWGERGGNEIPENGSCVGPR